MENLNLNDMDLSTDSEDEESVENFDDEEEYDDEEGFTYIFENGNSSIVRNNYVYKQKKVNKGSIYYICESCSASITIKNDRTIKQETTDHRHESLSDDHIECLKAMGQMKKRSASEAHSTIDAIYDSEVEKLNQNGICSDSIVLYLKPFGVMKSSLYYIRKKNLPSLPQSTDEIELPLKLSQTTENKRFLLFDTNDSDRIICYCSDVGFEILCGSEQWHLDGTFSAATSIYYQLFIIHGFYNNEVMFPCAFFFSQAKNL